jgi:hypothetical protein
VSTRVIIVIAILAPPAAILLAVLLAFRADTFRLSLADLKGLYATDQSLFTEISGVYTHFQDEGEGFPIVLIHGSEGTLRTWDPVVSAMKDRYRMIRLELAGRGLSAAGAPGTVSDDVTLHGSVLRVPFTLLASLVAERLRHVLRSTIPTGLLSW